MSVNEASPSLFDSVAEGPLPAGLARRGREIADTLATGRLAPGAMIGPYLVHGILGVGGQATVYRATHRESGRDVALKVPHGDLGHRFIREAQILARLQHPRIVQIESASFDGATPYLAMELARGSLADRLAHAPDHRLAPADVTQIAADVLEALAFAHAQGVIHRDMKPANILFDDEGRAKVADFGIGTFSLQDDPALVQSVARSAAAGGATVFAGTPAYMAPEQEDPRKRVDGKIDGRADLFALGKVVYEALTGDSPRTIRPVSRARPGLVPAWDDFIFRLVEDRPQDRFPNATIARGSIPGLPSPPRRPRLPRPPDRAPVPVVSGMRNFGFVVCLIGLATHPGIIGFGLFLVASALLAQIITAGDVIFSSSPPSPDVSGGAGAAASRERSRDPRPW